MSPAANTDGWGNKLVTIFARHLDNLILTNNFSLICQIRDFGSGQILQPRQFYLSPGFAKIAPWWLARRDNILAKVPGLVSADGATNVYSLNRRAVNGHARRVKTILVTSSIHSPWQLSSHFSLTSLWRAEIHRSLPGGHISYIMTGFYTMIILIQHAL